MESEIPSNTEVTIHDISFEPLREIMKRQAEDRVHRIGVGTPSEYLELKTPEDVETYLKNYRESRAILDKILEETNAPVD